MADQYSDQFSSPEAVRLARQMAARRANNAPSSSSPKYELGYDSDGNTVLVPSSPAAEPARRNRIMEGISEGFGEQPLAGVSEEDRRNYPTLSRFLDPAQKAMNAVVRAPGAIAGGVSGAFGAGVEALTGDRGNANYQQRQMKSLLDYIGLSEAAGAGGPKGAAPTPKVNPVTQYRKAYESTPSEGPIGVVQSPVGSARRPEMGGQRYSQDVARQARIDEIIKQAANDTAQTRQTSAVQEAIDAAARRAREGMPREMTADEIAAMRQSFAEANPEPASPMSLPVATGTVLAGSLASRNRPAAQQPFAGTEFFAPAPQRSVPAGYMVDDQSAAGLPDISGGSLERDAPAVAKQIIAARAQAPVGGKAGSPQPPRRPDDLPRQEPGILSRIFSGKDYQSQGGELRQDGKINWGNPESSADFFRADKARLETPDAAGMARGGAANPSPTKEALLHKSLEIIHHMLRSR